MSTKITEAVIKGPDGVSGVYEVGSKAYNNILAGGGSIISTGGSTPVQGGVVSGPTVSSKNSPVVIASNTSTAVPTKALGTQPIQFPTKPTVQNPGNIVAGNNAGLSNLMAGLGYSLDANNQFVYTPPKTNDTAVAPASSDNSGLEDIFNQYLGLEASNKPPKLADIYNNEYQASGIDEKQSAVNGYTAKLNSIVAKANADSLSIIGQGKGIPQEILNNQDAEIKRRAAIEALPVQAQLSAAQGDLQMAKDHLDTVFKLKAQDAQQQFEYKSKIIDSVYEFATKSEEKRLDALKTQEERQYKDKKDNLSLINEWSKIAVEAGQQDLISQFTELDPESPTFTQDLGKLQAKLTTTADGTKLQSVEHNGKLYTFNPSTGAYTESGLDGGDSGPNQEVDALARMYASGQAITPQMIKESGTTYSAIQQAAKELPKPEGTLVDRNTGVRSPTLSSSQEDGIVALRDLTRRLDDLKTKYNQTHFYSNEATRQSYVDDRNEIVDLLARARTGAAITASEEATYKAKLPELFGITKGSIFTASLPAVGNQKIDDLKSSLSGKLNNTLTTQGLSIYGYSKVKIGDKEYTVGDKIDNGNGQVGTVLPDGTLSVPDGSFNQVGNTSASIQIPKSSRLSYVNNNPGNLRFAGQNGATEGQGGFAKFSTPQAGFLALVNQIKLDAKRGHTLESFIAKFAPPSENDTKTYISQVAKSLGVKPNSSISNVNAQKLAAAIARKESSTRIS